MQWLNSTKTLFGMKIPQEWIVVTTFQLTRIILAVENMSAMHDLRDLLSSRSDPVLDKRHRVKFGGSLNYEFKNLHQFLPLKPTVINSLKNDCSRAYSYRSSSEEDEDDIRSVHSTDYHNDGCTFFLKAEDSPRCALEELARRVFLLHTTAAEFDPSTSGAEWWTQVVDSNSDIGFHWDKDYAYEQTTGVNLFPHLGTVTYLTDTGGPTVVLRRPGCPMSADDHSGLPSDIVISHPQIGKHIKFDGQLLHAAPASLCSSMHNQGSAATPTKRVTFLVNIWLNHIPIRTMPFPADLAQALTPIENVFVHSKNDSAEATTGSVKCPQLPLITFDKKARQPLPLDLHSWKFNNGNMKYIVYIPLPTSDRLASLSKQFNAYSFVYKGSGVESRIERQKSIDSSAKSKATTTRKRQHTCMQTNEVDSHKAQTAATSSIKHNELEEKDEEVFGKDQIFNFTTHKQARHKVPWRLVHKMFSYSF